MLVLECSPHSDKKADPLTLILLSVDLEKQNFTWNGGLRLSCSALLWGHGITMIHKSLKISVVVWNKKQF